MCSLFVVVACFVIKKKHLSIGSLLFSAIEFVFNVRHFRINRFDR